jgi:Transmembrane secretion effector
MGLARTVFNPTVRAAFPSVVGGGDLTRANALISGTFSTSIMVGPALGGLLVASVGAFLTILTINATVPAEVFLGKESVGAEDAGYGLLVSFWGAAWCLAPP